MPASGPLCPIASSPPKTSRPSRLRRRGVVGRTPRALLPNPQGIGRLPVDTYTGSSRGVTPPPYDGVGSGRSARPGATSNRTAPTGRLRPPTAFHERLQGRYCRRPHNCAVTSGSPSVTEDNDLNRRMFSSARVFKQERALRCCHHTGAKHGPSLIIWVEKAVEWEGPPARVRHRCGILSRRPCE